MAMFNPYQGGSSTPNWTGFDANRAQGRVNFLQKVRPKDQEIGQWQKLLTDYKAYQQGAGQNGSGAQTGQAADPNAPQFQQGLFSAGNSFGQNAQNYYNNAVNDFSANQPNYDNAPAMPGVNDFSADRNRIETAMFDKSKGRLIPNGIRTPRHSSSAWRTRAWIWARHAMPAKKRRLSSRAVRLITTPNIPR